jgi:hypothetical protein
VRSNATPGPYPAAAAATNSAPQIAGKDRRRVRAALGEPDDLLVARPGPDEEGDHRQGEGACREPVDVGDAFGRQWPGPVGRDVLCVVLLEHPPGGIAFGGRDLDDEHGARVVHRGAEALGGQDQ